MKSMFLTLAAVFGFAVAAASIPVANANADALYNVHGTASLSSNANQ
jgi:hypothetical protein